MNSPLGLLDYVAILLSVICLVEFVRLLAWRRLFVYFMSGINKSLKVIHAKYVSDTWKQKALLAYSKRLFLSSLILLLFIFLSLSVFIVVDFLILSAFDSASIFDLNYIANYRLQVAVLVVGFFYAKFRLRSTPNENINELPTKNTYSGISKLFHEVALGNLLIQEFAFHIDCLFFAKKTKKQKAPIFVTGLARSGTTILLKAIYSSGNFTTLTYRDMPFVCSPIWWGRLNSKFRKNKELEERAHGDRILVDFDSPEAFEEVFWRTFLGAKYSKILYLKAHRTSKKQRERYERYVSNLLSREDSSKRYLAKNNNNTLRIGTLKKAFPKAQILVPFRHPFSHAKSLLSQHLHFCKVHEEDPFSLEYMNWLGHHEFGLNMKPFHVDSSVLPKNKKTALKLDYWLNYWLQVYRFLLKEHSEDLIFFDYELFCEEPERVLASLEETLHIKENSLKDFAKELKAPNQHEDLEISNDLKTELMETYQELRNKALLKRR